MGPPTLRLKPMKWYTVLNQQAHASYFEAAKIAVLTCLENTRLRPNVLWDGDENHEFAAWLRAKGVTVHPAVTPFLAELEASRGVRGLNPDAARGAYLRLLIPSIENEDRWVLYTDCDVMFLSDPSADLAGVRPRLLAATFESNRTNTRYFNSGAMVLNVEALRAGQAALIDSVRRNLPNWVGFSPNDQGALNYFYRGVWEPLAPEMNWKPYWGVNPDAHVIHFHGCRPHEIVDVLSGGSIAGSKAEFLVDADMTALEHYASRYFGYFPQIYGACTRISKVVLGSRTLRTIIELGEESPAHACLALDVQVDDGPVLRQSAPIPPPERREMPILTQCPLSVLESRDHRIRAKLAFLPGDWVEIRTRGLAGEKPSTPRYYWIEDHLRQPQGHASADRRRVAVIEPITLKPYYCVLSAGKRLTCSGRDVAASPVDERDYPNVAVGWKLLDKGRDARVWSPEGLPLFADRTTDWTAAKRAFLDRPSLGEDEGLRRAGMVVITSQGLRPVLTLPAGALLTWPSNGGLLAWFGELLSRLVLYQSHEDARIAPCSSAPSMKSSGRAWPLWASRTAT